MNKRVAQHQHDKLATIKNPIIEYFAVESRCDAELLETYLINHYDTGKYYNIKKAGRGDVSFLEDVELPWIRYGGEDEPNVFYVKSNVEVVKEKVIYKNGGSSLDAKIREGDNKIREIAQECDRLERQVKNITETDIPVIEQYIQMVERGDYKQEEIIPISVARENVKLLKERADILSGTVKVLRSWPWIEGKYSGEDLDNMLDKGTINKAKLNEFYMRNFGVMYSC